MSVETDLFGTPTGKTTETTEYGNRMIRDNSFGKKGSVEHSNGSNAYDGAWYAGGPKMFEPVQRTVITIVGPWVPVKQEGTGR